MNAFGKSIAAVLAAATMTSGCATIIKGSEQQVNVASTPTEAKFTILNNKSGQSIHAGVTPQIVTLKRKGNYTVRFEKKGFKTREVTLAKGPNGWVFGNIVFGGLIGVIIDASTGAMFAIKDVNGALEGQDLAFQVRTMDSLSPAERANLVPVG